MKFSMSDWQALQAALERSRADSAELHRDRSSVRKLLDSIPPRSRVTCLSPGPLSPNPVFGNDRTTNLLKNR